MKYIIEICVAIDVAILGIAYPILTDKISNIGQKYNSEYLPNIFDSKYPDFKIAGVISFFQLLLILTLLSLTFKIFPFEPIENFKGNIIIENSADIIVFLLTLFLTITFFIWINKIILYQGKASELLEHLIKLYKSQNEQTQIKTYLLKTINEFAIFAIEKQDPHLQEPLLDFYSEQFYNLRNNYDEKTGPVYPFDLCYVTNEIINTTIKSKNSKLKPLEHRAASNIWLIGESFKFAKISASTYTWIWRNLVTASTQKSLIASYWSSASQYYNYSNSNTSYNFKIDKIEDINEDDNNQLSLEKQSFLELNYALGGLLFYQNEYGTLNYIITFSQSQPPTYPLLPNTMDEIFYWFEHFSNEYKFRKQPIEYKYFFPEIDNLGVSANISHNICLYISILFIRQLNQEEIYVYQNFKTFHNLTNNLQELHSINERLPYFKNCIKKILTNTELLNQLSFRLDEFDIFKVFNDLENQIKEHINYTKLNTNLSDAKIRKFYSSTKETLVNAFNEYLKIKNPTHFDNFDENNISSINGELIISSKSSFIDNETPNLNFDTIYSEYISNNKIKYFIPNSFLFSKTDKFLIEKNKLIEGLEKIIGNKKEITIISIRPSFESSQLLNESKFKHILIEIPSTNNNLNDTFFILDKKDLPIFESKDLPIKDIKKFGLEKLDENYNIFSKIIDINRSEYLSLKQEYITEDDKDLKVLILISFVFLIKWKKDRRITMLSLNNPYQERGIVNNIEDLKPL